MLLHGRMGTPARAARESSGRSTRGDAGSDITLGMTWLARLAFAIIAQACAFAICAGMMLQRLDHNAYLAAAWLKVGGRQALGI